MRNPEIRATRGVGAAGVAGEVWFHRGDVVEWLHAAAEGLRDLELEEVGPLSIGDVAAAVDLWADYLLGVKAST